MPYRDLKTSDDFTDLSLTGRFIVNDDCYIFGKIDRVFPLETPWSTNSFKAVFEVKTGGEDINKIKLRDITCQRRIFQELLDTVARLPFP